MPSGIASLPYSQRDQEPEAPLHLQLRARFASQRLDRLMARGTSPEESPLLAARARQLVDADARDRLAASVERLVALANENPHALVGPARAPFGAKRVLSNRLLFGRIAEILRQSRPPAVRGIAMTSVLLRDNASALYANDSPGDLREVLNGIADALEH